MKRSLICLVAFFLTTTLASAHSLLLSILDNEDGTITVEGMFSTGESAEGAKILIESLQTGRILFEQRLPEESELTINIPEEPYQIVLDGGPGHTTIKPGIAPPGGFAEEILARQAPQSQVANASAALANPWPFISRGAAFGIAFILFGLTLYFCHRNTRKLMAAMKTAGRQEHE